MNFIKLDIEHKNIFDEYFKIFQPEIADLTFTNLYMWKDYYNLYWTEHKNYLLIMAKPENTHPFLHGPVGLEINSFEEVIYDTKKFFEENGLEFIIKRASEKTVELLNTSSIKFLHTAERDLSDYVYIVEDLIQLKGKKYHAKKNHINKFLKTYEGRYQIREIDHTLIDKCYEFECEWYKNRNGEKDIGLTYEKKAIENALKHYEILGYKGISVFIDNQVKAFTFGEPLNSDTVVIHIEKADPEIEGLYTFINQAFLKYYWSDYKYVNREEDLGKEGIRKAKLSYHPYKFAYKYTISFK
ncbi:DUF2156 domain-containing protein [Caldicellulosiruptoraceae bacterium PP1]